jgi:cobalt-zinc-cadmium efflux system outer membrane protein
MRLVFLLSAAVLVARPSCAQQLSERDAVARLLSEDPRLRAISARIDQVRAAQADRTLWPNPSATFSRESVAETHDSFLLLRQELPISGRRADLRSAGRFAVDAAEAEARRDRLELQADVRTAYTALLVAQGREVAIADAIAGLQKLIGVLRARESAGEGSTYDRLRGERALADLEADRALAAGDRAAAQGQLAAFLGPGIVPAALVASDALTPASAPPAVPVLIEQALANRGEYRAAQLSVDRFEAERAAAARLRIPTPTLTGGLKQSAFAGATHSGYQFSLDLSLPMFNRGQTATALASAQRAEAAAEIDARRIRIEAEVAAAHTVLTILQQRVVRYQDSAAAIALDLARIGRVAYEEGELGILELLDAERQALDARLQIVELVGAARRAAIELDRVIGQEFRP